MRRLLTILGIAALITAAAALPFVPGSYDPLAAPVSMLAILFGRVGLLLVIGAALWTFAERARASAPARYAAAIGAVIVVAVVSLAMALGAFALSFTIGLTMLAACATSIIYFVRRARRLRSDSPPRGSIPVVLAAVPVLTLAAQLLLADTLTESARNRAIANAAPLITVIERHRAERGRYPRSFASMHPDINTGVIGVDRYRYEPADSAYNLYFELPSFRLGTREVVMYSPHDEHAMTSHLLDVLELSPEQLRIERTRGHNELHSARQPHWKYYWFD
jgi:hypothetical protein